MTTHLFKYIAAVVLFLAVCAPVAAADDAWKNPTDTLAVKIPGLTLSSPAPCPGDPTRMCVPWIGEYIAAIYKYGTGLAGTVAVVMMMVAGARWILAGGNPSTVADAKNKIMAALSGVVLLLASYTILYFINPDLVGLPSIGVMSPKPSASSLPSSSVNAGCQWLVNYCPETHVPASDVGRCGTAPEADSESGIIFECCCPRSYATGVCAATDSGICSIDALTPVFGERAAQASAICLGESGGVASVGSGVDKTTDGKPISIGLFQINLSAHPIGGLNCPSAFTGMYTARNRNVQVRPEPQYQQLYNQCVSIAQNPAMNIAKAKAIFDVSGWRAWGYNSVCKY